MGLHALGLLDLLSPVAARDLAGAPRASVRQTRAREAEAKIQRYSSSGCLSGVSAALLSGGKRKTAEARKKTKCGATCALAPDSESFWKPKTGCARAQVLRLHGLGFWSSSHHLPARQQAPTPWAPTDNLSNYISLLFCTTAVSSNPPPPARVCCRGREPWWLAWRTHGRLRGASRIDGVGREPRSS